MSIILSFIIIENVINSLTFTNVVNYIFYQNKQYMKLVNFVDSKFAAPLQYWGFLKCNFNGSRFAFYQNKCREMWWIITYQSNEQMRFDPLIAIDPIVSQ